MLVFSRCLYCTPMEGDVSIEFQDVILLPLQAGFYTIFVNIYGMAMV